MQNKRSATVANQWMFFPVRQCVRTNRLSGVVVNALSLGSRGWVR